MAVQAVVYIIGAAAVFLAGHVSSADVPQCVDQTPCLTYFEQSCVSGSRQVCLGSNAAATGCTLSGDSIDIMCSLPNTIGAGTDPKVDGVGQTCQTVLGGTNAMFAVADGTTASGVVGGQSIALLTGGGTVTAGCIAEQTQRCVNTPVGVTNAIWTIPVTSCTCICGEWAEWGTCGATCQNTRTRSCTPPSPEIDCSSDMMETAACSGGNCLGCTCSPDWSQWTTCSSTCQGGTRMRTRACSPLLAGVVCETITETGTCGSATCVDPVPFNCNCGGYSSFGSCSVSCSSATGTATRTRICTPNPMVSGAACPTSIFPTTDTGTCMGSSDCTADTTTVAPVTTTTQTPPMCNCDQWANMGGCTVSCGNGFQTRTRTCTNCPTTTQTTDNFFPCALGACPTVTPPNCQCTVYVPAGGCHIFNHSCSRLETRTCPGLPCPTQLPTRRVNCSPRACNGRRRGRGGRRRGRGRGRGGRRRGRGHRRSGRFFQEANNDN